MCTWLVVLSKSVQKNEAILSDRWTAVKQLIIGQCYHNFFSKLKIASKQYKANNIFSLHMTEKQDDILHVYREVMLIKLTEKIKQNKITVNDFFIIHNSGFSYDK